MNCPQCKTYTKNPKFCSRSCATTFNNRLSPKRKKRSWSCEKCGTETTSRRKLCDSCRPFLSLLTKQQALTSDTQKYRRIRDHARRVAQTAGLLDCCFVCAYSTHVETCHIQSIKSFSDTTKISVINALSNLVGLCPNHHWEFDHSLLKLPIR